MAAKNIFGWFDAGARRAVDLAQQEARRLDHNYIGSEHFLLGLIHEGESAGAKALGRFGISLEKARGEVERTIGHGLTAPSGHLPFTPRAKKILELSLAEAFQLGHDHIGCGHLLLGLVREGHGFGAQVLIQLGVDLNRLRQEVVGVMAERHPVEADSSGKGRALTRAWPLLDQCGSDLTAAARRSLLDPVFGRDREIERVVQILTRRQRNVPLLIGEPGVGKTAVASGLAQSIVAGTVPSALQRQTVRTVDLGILLANPRHRGRDTAVLTELLDEVQGHGDLVVFLCGALSPLHLSDGTTDALTVCRSLIGTPGVLVIGSCTTSDHERRGVTPALDRSLQPVPVAEPAQSDLLDILKSVRARLEDHHRVSITDEALEAAASLARDHVPDQHLPGSAIDLLDEASAQVRVREVRTNDQRMNAALQHYDAQIADVRQAKEKAIDQQDFERAALMRQQEKTLLRERHRAAHSETGPTVDLPCAITEADVVNALSVYSGTQPPEPARSAAARQVPPAEHDPYVWSMS